MRPHIFMDVDGVMGDFDSHCEALFGAHPNRLGDDLMWRRVNADHHGFWGGMPLKEGAMELWHFIRDFEPTFLTGCPKEGYHEAASHKRIWLAKHFGPHVPVITCRSRDKPLHMMRPGDVLVDDMSRNIRRWEEAGGRGIRYRNHRQALHDLRRLLD